MVQSTETKVDRERAEAELYSAHQEAAIGRRRRCWGRTPRNPRPPEKASGLLRGHFGGARLDASRWELRAYDLLDRRPRRLERGVALASFRRAFDEVCS